MHNLTLEEELNPKQIFPQSTYDYINHLRLGDEFHFMCLDHSLPTPLGDCFMIKPRKDLRYSGIAYDLYIIKNKSYANTPCNLKSFKDNIFYGELKEGNEKSLIIIRFEKETDLLTIDYFKKCSCPTELYLLEALIQQDIL